MSMKYQGPLIWNDISSNVDVDCCPGTFKKRAKIHFAADYDKISSALVSLLYIFNVIKLTTGVDDLDHISVIVVLSTHLLYTMCHNNPLYFVAFIPPLTNSASALLIYPLTDLGADKLIGFRLHYACACTVHREYEINILLPYLIMMFLPSVFYSMK